MALQQESLFLDVPYHQSLHIRHFSPDKGAQRVAFLVHGSLESGRIFYSNNGKGLGPYLARNGYAVYVIDLAGRGRSIPKMSRTTRNGQYEAIVHELPAALALIAKRHPDLDQVWMGHSWGGVLNAALLVRQPQLRSRCKAMVNFGTKRVLAVKSLKRLLLIEFFWKTVAPLAIAIHGYLPAKRYKMGADSESKRFHAQTSAWLKPGPWIDPEDNFNYSNALDKITLPATLHLAGAADKVLGNPKDVAAFRDECGQDNGRLEVVGRETGYSRDYGHIDIMTHPDAEKDHFPKVLEFLKQLDVPHSESSESKNGKNGLETDSEQT